MTTLERTPEHSSDSQSPFDAIKQTREDGSEFWSARDLQPLLGYANWQQFERPIERAMQAAHNQNMDLSSNFSGSTKVSNSGPAQKDFHLSRYAAYLVAMNGDPNKSEVAAAQDYFARQTRFAEVIQENPALLARDHAPETAIAPVISVHEIGTLYDETMDEFKRVVSPTTVDTLTAHNLSASLLELTKSMSYLVIAGTGIAAPQTQIARVDMTAMEALPPVSNSGGQSLPDEAGAAVIRITEDVEDPITWDEFARTEGHGRCGSCAQGLSNRIKHASVKQQFPRGRTPYKHNVFERAVWQKFYAEWKPFYDALHVEHSHGGDFL